VAVAVGVKRKQTSQFNKPSLVLLLKNMVGPDEVDEQLGPETQQECQRYGPVASCLVHALPPSVAGLRCPDEERVRTFVEFHSQESAVRAFR
jgi:splicing factor 45